jgi:hypothetical protein
MNSFDLAKFDIPELTASLARLEPGQQIALQLAGKTVAVVVSPDDAKFLAAIEDHLDIAAADSVLLESNEQIPGHEMNRDSSHTLTAESDDLPAIVAAIDQWRNGDSGMPIDAAFEQIRRGARPAGNA